MKNWKTPFLGLMTIGALLALPAMANDSSKMTDKKMSSKLNQSDLKILSRLHQINQEEIEMGKMASDKGSSDRVKSYGEELVKDHETADSKIEELASGMNVEESSWKVPMDDKGMKMKDRFSKLEGAEFDREFSRAMEKGHAQAIDFASRSQRETKSPEIKRLFSELMPKLKHHRDVASDLSKGLPSDTSA